MSSTRTDKKVSGLFLGELKNHPDTFLSLDRPPEEVNFDEPPARLLGRLYKQATKKNYKKVVYGGQLFKKLDPGVAYAKCPTLKALLDEMLALAVAAGLGPAKG